MKQENKELYLVPEISVMEIASDAIICLSNPGETPDNLDTGGWI